MRSRLALGYDTTRRSLSNHVRTECCHMLDLRISLWSLCGRDTSGVDFMASIASRNSSSSNGFGTRSRPASSSYFEKPPTRTGFLDPAPSAPPLSALSSPGAASPETLVSAPASAPAAKASSSSSNG
eukprot:6202222-Pleurochrysis_carterae.AAC.3